MSEFPVNGSPIQGRVVAVFTSRDAAWDAATEVAGALAVRPDQIELVTRSREEGVPGVEVDEPATWRALAVGQWRPALAGAVFGLIACVCLYAAGVPIVEQSTGWSVLLLSMFGGACGLLLGTLMPQRPAPLQAMPDVPASDIGTRTTVLVHTTSDDECGRVANFMRRRGADVTLLQ